MQSLRRHIPVQAQDWKHVVAGLLCALLTTGCVSAVAYHAPNPP
jgi:hypothetical protein